MGNFTLSRSTLRTHGSRYGGGSSGPPFLVCALFIGLSIISISYYSLSSQYTQLEHRMADLIVQQNTLQDQLLTQQKSIKETQTQLASKSKQLDEQIVLNTQIKKELTLKQVELNQSRAKLTELTKTESDLRKQLNDERHNRIDTAKQNDAKLKESPKPLSSALGLNKSTIDHNSGMPSNDQHDAIVKFVKSTDKKAGSKPLATPDSDKTKHDKSL